MPIPVVKKGSSWVFNIQKGKQEILNRRIGRNELQVMDELHAYVDAQHEYATKDCGSSGTVEFAQRIISTEGKHDGLYWEAKEGEEESPLGPLVAQAAKEGFANPNLQPFHGYYFTILKGQGKHADGGAYHYVVKGKMILGFAIIAYPAEYGNSGVMTFMVNQQGIIYQKNLGKNTKRSAESLKIFNPDKTWTKIEEGRHFLGSSSWSADSRTLYYGSNRDDFYCVWAQRFTSDGKPSGEPFAAFHNHQPPDMNSYLTCMVQAARDRLYLLLADFKGDLWSLQLPK
jgi:hypothetical protein